MNIADLRLQIAKAEDHLAHLRRQLQEAELRESFGQNGVPSGPPISSLPSPPGPRTSSTEDDRPLDLEEYKRYGRQMIVSSIGLEGQIKLKSAKVLIVGLGGLGCPAATYLAGAGVGTLGLVDGDTVELSNLHRQTLHSVDTIGWNKAESASRYLTRLNPKVRYHQYPHHLDAINAVDLFEQYDLVLDCTDHPTSRYLISDVCVLAGKPLVSASALRTEGQLMALNMPPGSGPCYRCIFPKPPPAESVISCGEGGILGPVVGVIGVLQAAKALEVITLYSSLIDAGHLRLEWKDMPAKLVIYSAMDAQPFRPPITLKQRRSCASCSSSPTITKESLRSGSLDYTVFCGLTVPVNILDKDERISAREYKQKLDDMDHCHMLVDVRENLHFDICRIPGSYNMPYSCIASRLRKSSSQASNVSAIFSSSREKIQWEDFIWFARKNPKLSIYFVCRFGNDSQEAVRFIKNRYPELIRNGTDKGFIGDIEGGLHAWSKVDPTFPDY